MATINSLNVSILDLDEQAQMDLIYKIRSSRRTKKAKKKSKKARKTTKKIDLKDLNKSQRELLIQELENMI